MCVKAVYQLDIEDIDCIDKLVSEKYSETGNTILFRTLLSTDIAL